jgi:hypothetical protein
MNVNGRGFMNMKMQRALEALWQQSIWSKLVWKEMLKRFYKLCTPRRNGSRWPFSPRAKGTYHLADHLPPHNLEVKSMRSYTWASHVYSRYWVLIKCMENFALCYKMRFIRLNKNWTLRTTGSTCKLPNTKPILSSVLWQISRITFRVPVFSCRSPSIRANPSGEPTLQHISLQWRLISTVYHEHSLDFRQLDLTKEERCEGTVFNILFMNWNRFTNNICKVVMYETLRNERHL